MAAQSKKKPATPEAERKHKRRRRLGTPLGWIEHRAQQGGDGVYHVLKHWPMLGVSLVTGAGLALALTVGAAELGLAAAAGYGSYLVLKKHEPPSKAFEEVSRLDF